MKKIFYIICFALTLGSCTDWLNVVPKNETVVESVEDVRTELLAYWASHVYAGYPLPSYGNSELSLPFYNDVLNQLAMYSDDINMATFKQHSDITEKVMTVYYQDVNWKGRDLAKSLWVDSYATIGFMNAILYDLEKAGPSQAENETIGGEAKMIRAWCIFKLVQFFSSYTDNDNGIPLNLDSENTTPSGRWKQTEIYSVIEREMNEVLTYTATPQKWNFFYTPAFVHSFLAEFYQYKAGSPAAAETDWANAEKHAALVVENYTFEQNAEVLSSPFEASNTGYYPQDDFCALKLATRRSCNLGSSYTGIWGLNNAQQVATELWDMYLPADIRRTAWFQDTWQSGLLVHCIKKPTTYETGPVCDMLVLYRKAEVLLIRLEALCHLGRAAEAAQLLTTFRQARIPGYQLSVSADKALEEVLKERRMELCYENGIRFLDLKRLGLGTSRKGLSQKSGTITYSLEPGDYRFALPIPQTEELDYNGNITQNPGWTSYE